MIKTKYKRYCKTLQLKNDPALIEEYKHRHLPDMIWPEIIEGLKQVGVLEMEIYLSGTTLFMIMDTTPDFDHQRAMQELAELSRQKDWESEMAKYQETSSDATASEKWIILDKVFDLNPKK